MNAYGVVFVITEVFCEGEWLLILIQAQDDCAGCRTIRPDVVAYLMEK